MANMRKEGKKQVTFWATEEERALLEEASRKAGFGNMSDYLKWVIQTQPRPPAPPPPSKSKKPSVKRAKPD